MQDPTQAPGMNYGARRHALRSGPLSVATALPGLLLIGGAASALSAQSSGLRLEPLATIDTTGGRVIAVDVDEDGKRLATVGEFHDVAVWDVEGHLHGHALLPECERVRHVALHPVHPHVAVAMDRSVRNGPWTFDVGLICTEPATTAASVASSTLRLPGAVLGLAWSSEGSFLAVGWVGRDGSRVDVFAPWRGALRPVETVPVERLVDVLAGAVTPPALGPFVNRWRCQGRELLPMPRGDGRADPPPPLDGLLVADAQAQFARFAGNAGVGVDRIGQTFVRRDDRMRVHAFNHGPVLGMMFTPDGRYLAVASRAAVTVATTTGTERHVVAGKHLLAPGDGGAELVLLGERVRRYDAAQRTFIEGTQLPAADTGTGEDDARLYGRPQMRTALRLPDRRFVVGGYSQFGHESLVVDVERKATRLVADSEREADDHLIVDVRQTALLSGERWASGELLRAQRGAFRRSSVLRVFDGAQPRWAREWRGILTAFVATPDGTLVVADETGTLTVVAAASGEPGSSVRLPRAARWLAMLDGETMLLHDGVELATFSWPALTPLARGPLPAGAPVVAAALAPIDRLLALGRGARALVYRVGR